MIGIFTRPFSTAGPIMADPPSPIATTRTDADGHHVIWADADELRRLGQLPGLRPSWANKDRLAALRRPKVPDAGSIDELRNWLFGELVAMIRGSPSGRRR